MSEVLRPVCALSGGGHRGGVGELSPSQKPSAKPPTPQVAPSTHCQLPTP